MRILLTGLLSALMLIVGCKVETSNEPLPTSQLTAEGRAYADPNEQAMFIDALKKENIPFAAKKRADGLDYVQWEARYSERVSQIETRLFGISPPSGRNISLEGKQKTEFISWLTKHGIPHQVISFRGKEYIVWEEADHARVKRHPLIAQRPF